MKIGVISLFPDFFKSLEQGLIGRALQSGLVEFYIENLRPHGEGAHKVVDDTPYGGGDGMILKSDPIRSALFSLLDKMNESLESCQCVYMCPSGEFWNQKLVENHVKDERPMILLCGRYGGVDERVLEKFFPKRYSVGPFILNGGETAALCVIESLVRGLPGVLGNSSSVQEDSLSNGGGIEAPSYTKPRVWEDMEVPEVLLSGDHGKIDSYRREVSKEMTREWYQKQMEILSGFKTSES